MLNRSQPTSPSTPIWRTWRRYIPAMPASARVAIAIFMPWRTFHCVLWTKSTVISGCLTCTAMNSVPAATAARPAARVSFVVVISMVSSMSAGVRGCCCGTALKPRNQRGDPASPDDVTGWVRSSAVSSPWPVAHAGLSRAGPGNGGSLDWAWRGVREAFVRLIRSPRSPIPSGMATGTLGGRPGHHVTRRSRLGLADRGRVKWLTSSVSPWLCRDVCRLVEGLNPIDSRQVHVHQHQCGPELVG